MIFRQWGCDPSDVYGKSPHRRRETEISYASYARWGGDDSDVYVFMNIKGYLECCACSIEELRTFKAHTTRAMVRHLDRHVNAGHIVPDYAVPALMADDDVNFGEDE